MYTVIFESGVCSSEFNSYNSALVEAKTFLCHEVPSASIVFVDYDGTEYNEASVELASNGKIAVTTWI